MNTLHLVIGFAAASAFLLSAAYGAPELFRPSDDKAYADMRAVADGSNAFAFDLYSRLKDRPGNLFLSPYSIDTALSMAYAGARGGTAAEMAKALALPDLPPAAFHAATGGLVRRFQADAKGKGYELHVANALWAPRGGAVSTEYARLLSGEYAAQIQALNFADAPGAAKTINDWVSDRTKGKIKDLISPGALGHDTRLVLTNAIYFKGDWARPFSPAVTRDAPWLLPDAEKTPPSVPMMHQTGSFGFFQDDSISALDLPYAGHELSMLVILPKDTSGLAEVEKGLDPKRVEEVVAGLAQREVAVALPKFRIEAKFELGDTLGAMGMRLAFGPTADFSGIDGRRDFLISDVVHKAFVEVDEKGTEAAGATGIVMRATAVRADRLVFNADHPFAFVIRDQKRGTVLFIGRVVDPSH